MSFAAALRAVIRVAVAAVAAVVGTLAVNAGYFLISLRLRGEPTPAALAAARIGASYVVLGLFLTAAGAILGARLAAGKAPRWSGLAAGAGLALVVVTVGWVGGRLDFWLPPNALMAAVGGWLGGWLAGRT